MELRVTEHTSKQFDVEMEAIRSGVLSMGGLVETQIARAIEALKSSDVNLIDAVAADELAINHMQVDLDQQCSQIIARRQPAAIDLRMVMTVFKIVNELERIGDEVKKIAYKAQQMQRPERLSDVRFHEITRAAELAECQKLRFAHNAGSGSGCCSRRAGRHGIGRPRFYGRARGPIGDLHAQFLERKMHAIRRQRFPARGFIHLAQHIQSGVGSRWCAEDLQSAAATANNVDCQM